MSFFNHLSSEDDDGFSPELNLEDENKKQPSYIAPQFEDFKEQWKCKFCEKVSNTEVTCVLVTGIYSHKCEQCKKVTEVHIPPKEIKPVYQFKGCKTCDSKNKCKSVTILFP